MTGLVSLGLRTEGSWRVASISRSYPWKPFCTRHPEVARARVSQQLRHAVTFSPGVVFPIFHDPTHVPAL